MHAIKKMSRRLSLAIGTGLAVVAGMTNAASADVTGFNSGTGWTANTSGPPAPAFTASSVQITTVGVENYAASVFFNTPQSVAGGFEAHFIYQQTATSDPGAPGDGITFCIQNSGLTALGGQGSSLGYQGIGASLAVALDVNQGFPRRDTTGLGTNGNYADGNGFPSAPVVISSGRRIDVTLSYNATTGDLSQTLRDLTTGDVFNHTYPGINLAGLLGGGAGWVGFTGATGQSDNTQIISDFTLTTTPTTPADITGFSNGKGWTRNSSRSPLPGITADTLQITTVGIENYAASAYFNTRQAVGGRFDAHFIYQQTATADPNAPGDGITFVIQNSGLNALGGQGSSLGYQGIGASLAVALDVNQGFPRRDTTGLGMNGNYADGNGFPSAPVVISSGRRIDVTLSYNGLTRELSQTLRDLTTGDVFNHTYPGINLVALLGGNFGWVGFTGATGQSDNTQVISGFTFTGEPLCIADFNHDGTVNSTDVSDFINAWFTDQVQGTLVTDWDVNGVVNSTDVSAFINSWFEDQVAGCE